MSGGEGGLGLGLGENFIMPFAITFVVVCVFFRTVIRLEFLA